MSRLDLRTLHASSGRGRAALPLGLAALLFALAAVLLPAPDPAEAQSTPAFSSAKLTDDYKVTVNFTEDINPDKCPWLTGWTVTYNGRAETPVYAACYDRSVVLHSRSHNQSPSLAEHRTVTVSYDKTQAAYGSRGARLQSVTGDEVASFSNRPVRNEYPLLSGASVNGKVLTLTYDQPLDEGSAPPGSAFSLGVSGGSGLGVPPAPQPSVVRTAVSGNAVTVTLDVAVAHDRRMSVGYVPPASNPIRNPDGGEAKAITWRDYLTVRVLTPDPGVAPTFYSANLIHDRYASETRLQANFDEGLDEDSLPAGSAFRVTAKPRSGGGARTVAGTGTVRLTSAAVVSVTLAEQVDPDAIVTVSYVKPSANPLRGSDGNDLESFSGKPVNNGTPEIISVALSSNAGPDRTYARGDKIQVQITFSSPVEVRGTPRQQLIQGQSHPERSPSRGGDYYPWAEYESGSGTRTLTFAYTVKELDRSNGIGVWSWLDLNGGAIRSVWLWPHYAADLSHPQTWLPYNSAHKVDGSRKDNTFFESAAVDLKALTLTFDETLDTGSVPSPSAFHVTVNDPRRDVASGGVAISGKTVTLTLASVVSSGDTVKVRYTRPSARPLRSTSGQGVDTFPDRAVTNDTRPILFSSAAVDGTALTLTFDQTLVTGSVPAPGAFHVTVNGARRDVAASGVAISGKAVTLTLASAVSEGDTVTVRYTRPSARPLRNTSGQDVDTFPDRAVTNKSGLWSATLRTGPTTTGGFGCWNGLLTECSDSDVLDEDSFTTGGTSYQVIRATRNTHGIHGYPLLILELDKAISRHWTLHVDDRPFPVADATLSEGDKVARWDRVNIPPWSTNPEVSLRLTSGGSGSSGAGGNSGGGDPASVTGVSVVSSAGADKTYGDGDRIEVRATFDSPVDVTGTPRIKIDMDPADWGEKWAVYEEDGGTTSLTFVHIVGEPNLSTQGIAVVANSLELNGGTIRSGGNDANLAHAGLGHDANHKVDWQAAGEESGGGGTGGGDGPGGTSGDDPQQQQSAPPAVSAVAVSSDAGDDNTYVKGDVISVSVTFDQAVTVTGTPRLKIDMDPAEWGEKLAAYHSGNGSNTLTFTHRVVNPNLSTQGIAVLANQLELNGGSIQANGVDADLSHSGLAHDASHKVDWRLPVASVTAVSITSDPGDDDTYGPEDVITITLTFSRAVDVTGTPRLKIDMDPAEWGEKLAAYHDGNGSNTLTFTYTVGEPNISTQGIAVLANSLELNGGTIQAGGDAADLSHSGLAHDASHKVDWQQQQEDGPGS